MGRGGKKKLHKGTWWLLFTYLSKTETIERAFQLWSCCRSDNQLCSFYYIPLIDVLPYLSPNPPPSLQVLPRLGFLFFKYTLLSFHTEEGRRKKS